MTDKQAKPVEPWNVTTLLGDFGEREQDFIFFTEPSYPENLPSHFICRDFFYFCPFNRGRARLQARGTAMNAHTRLKCNKQDKIPTKKEQFPEVVGNSHYEKIMESP